MLLTEPSAPVAAGLPDGHAGWPWEAEPYRLWRLLDMQRLSVAFFSILKWLERLKHELLLSEGGHRERSEIHRMLLELTEEGRKIPLRTPYLLQVKRLQNRLQATSTETPAMLLAAELDDLLENLIAELTEYLFFAVPPGRKWGYLDPGTWFGRAVVDRFPEAARDIRDACQCFALAQWTAAVFHAMRIVEHGLRALAVELDETLAAAVDLENWKTVIDRIEKRIRVLEQHPKGAEKSGKLEFYSLAAIQFRYFKDAWRNHVAHSRSDYDEQEAETVLAHVKQFMQQLAGREQPS